MQTFFRFFEKGSIVPVVLVAGVLVGFLAVVGGNMSPFFTQTTVDMRIEPQERTAIVGEIFEIAVVVESSVPVNVFAGELRFDPKVLSVDSIDYNTSIADLWAELPWFSNGDGTLNFAGGTTKVGGFQGVDSLIIVRFKTIEEGAGGISLYKPRILLHDGLGTDAAVRTIDAIVTVATTQGDNVIVRTGSGATYHVASNKPSTDLNNDGKQSIVDVSIFMLHIAGNDSRYDFNMDGVVGIQDLNIILGAK